MGLAAGLGFGCGLLLALQGFFGPARPVRTRARIAPRELLERAVRAFGSGILAAALTLVLTGVPAAAAIAGVAGGAIPALLRRRRLARDRRAAAASWPDAVDDLLTAVRAGVPLADALCEAAFDGPPPLRPGFSAFASAWRRGGSFSRSLAAMQRHFADPLADRVVVSLAMAARSGGPNVGRVLATQSDFLRADLRMRGEIEARHSWTVSAARVSVAAPWLAMLMLCLRGEAVEAFATATGAVVLLGAAVIGAAAYWAMMRIAALPQPTRLPELPA